MMTSPSLLAVLAFLCVLTGIPTVLPAADSATPPEHRVQVLSWPETVARIESHRGQPVLVDLWTTSCPACLEKFPAFVKLHERLGARLACLSVNCDYDGIESKPPAYYRPRVEAFLAKQQAQMEHVQLNEPFLDFLNAIDLESTPALLLYDAEGRLFRRFDNDAATSSQDEFTMDEVDRAVESLLAAADPGAANAPKASAADWPQFLGPDRNGVSRETGLLKEWPAEGPAEVWRVPGGVGMSSCIIADGGLYTLVQKEDRQWAICLDAATGATIWEHDLAPAYTNAMGNGPRATPAIADGRLFVFTGEGILAALKSTDGEILWRREVVAKLDGQPADYGMASSPLVVESQGSADRAVGRVIVTVGTPSATLIACDVKSGEIAWTAGQGNAAGYSSPVLRDVGGRRQVLAFHGDGALGVDPDTGRVLWDYPYKTDYGCNIALPLAIDGRVFLSAGENHGSVLLSLEPDGDGFLPEEVWSSEGTKSVLRNEWQTSILLEGSLYGFDNVGSAGPTTHFTCIDAATGARRWQQLRFRKGNLIAADGKLFLTTMEGELVILRANPERLEELGRKAYVGTTRQAPTLAGGRLYLRDDQEIVCIDVRSGDNP